MPIKDRECIEDSCRCQNVVALDKQAQLYKHIVENIDLGMIVIAQENYHVLYANNTAKEWMEGEVCGEERPCYQVFFGKSQICPYCPLHFEDVFEREREIYLPEQKSHRLYKVEKILWGNIPAYLLYVNDITIQREAERNYQVIVENTPGALVVMSIQEDGKVTPRFVNREFQMMTKMSYHELVQYYKEDPMQAVHPEDAPKVMHGLISMLKTGRMSEIYRLRVKNSRYIWVHAVGTASQNRKNETLYYVCFQDISSTVESQQELLIQKKLLEMTIEHSGLLYWEYAIGKKEACLSEQIMKQFHQDYIISDYPDSFIQSDIVHAEDKPAFVNAFRSIESGSGKEEFECRIRLGKKKPWTWHRIRVNAICDEKGNPVRAVCTAADISNEKRIEQKYKEEQRLRKKSEANLLASSLINLTKNRVEDIHVHHKQVLTNELEGCTDYKDRLAMFFEEIYITEKEYQALSVESLLQQYHYGVDFCSTDFFAQDKEYHRMRYIHVECSIYTRPDTGEIMAVFNHRDNTEKYVAETTVEAISSFDYDFSGIFFENSKRAYCQSLVGDKQKVLEEIEDCELWFQEYLKKYVRNRNLEMVFKRFQSYGGIIPFVIEKLREREFYSAEYDCSLDGKTIQRKEARFFYADRKHGVLVGICRDITEITKKEKENRMQLESALEEAHRASRAKTEFLSRMSHDMRTPMNAIMGLSNLALDSQNMQEMLGYMKSINESGRQLLYLINDTLEMSRIEQEKFALKPEPIMASDMFAEIVSTIKVLAKEKGVDFQIDVSSIEDVCLLADKLRISQIFINILSNAVKFTDSGGTVRFVVSCIKKTKTHASFQIVVEDTGIGISEEFLPHIFEAFQQENQEITSNYMGTGLGMSIVKKLVDAMDGTIEISSQKGIGTKITVTVSFRYDEKASAENRKPVFMYDFAGKRILLCEDHPMNRKIAVKLLEKEGCIVEVAENGKAGLTKFLQSMPGSLDAILMDIRMPVMDGMDATRQIRASGHPDAKSIPIIAMTANAYAEDVRLCLDAGMNAHLSKPIETAKLYQTLSQCIGAREFRKK